MKPVLLLVLILSVFGWSEEPPFDDIPKEQRELEAILNDPAQFIYIEDDRNRHIEDDRNRAHEDFDRFRREMDGRETQDLLRDSRENDLPRERPTTGSEGESLPQVRIGGADPLAQFGGLKPEDLKKMTASEMAHDVVSGQKTLITNFVIGLTAFKSVLDVNNDDVKAAAGGAFQRSLTAYFANRVAPFLEKEAAKLAGIAAGPASLIVAVGDIKKEDEKSEAATAKIELVDFFVDNMHQAARANTAAERLYRPLQQHIAKQTAGPAEAALRFDLLVASNLMAIREEKGAPELIFRDLADMWILQTKATDDDDRFQEGTNAFIFVVINEKNDVIEATIMAPSGDAIARQFNRMNPKGTEIFEMHSEIRVSRVEGNNPWPNGVLRIQDKEAAPLLGPSQSYDLLKEFKQGKIPNRIRFTE